MTYTANEASVQAGQPVELYQFVVGATRGFPAPPPPPGAFVTSDASVHEVRDEGTTIPGAPETGKSGILAGRGYATDLFPTGADPTTTRAGLSAWGAYHGGLGGSQGWFFARCTISGLLPSHTYVIRTLSGSFPASQAHGIRLGSDVEPGFAYDAELAREIENDLVGATAVSYAEDASATPVYTDTIFASNADGKIYLDAGHFDLEVGYANVVYLDGLWVYDPSEPVTPTTPGGIGSAYHYTSADVDVVFRGATYVSAILTRGQLASGGNEAGSSNLEVTLPRDHALVSVAGPPPQLPTNLTVYRVHRSDAAAGTSYATPWRGQLVERRFQDAACTLVFAPLAALLERKVPRYLTQTTCGHMLYDARCQASRAAFTSAALPVSAITGRVVTVDGAADAAEALVSGDTGFWLNGLLVAPDGTIGAIEAVSGDDLTLKRPLPGLAVGQSVTLTAGCDKLIGTCKHRFDNVVHFGGEPVMPVRNPGEGAGLGVSGGDA